jgi:murein DD-endopeptidase MepM/ murein hydrolase activator NlpD
MKKLNYNLPHEDGFVSTFKNLASIVPTNHSLNRFHSGSKIGKLTRHIFTHEHLNKIVGANIALAALALSMFNIPNFNSVAAEEIVPEVVIKADNLSLNTEKGVKLPVNVRKITQGYRLFHPGVDLDGITGDPIWPIMKGKVEYIQYSRFAYGNAVIINHGNGLTSLYAHLSKILVKEGQEVTTDTLVGLMGSTGRSTGDHLHLEIRDHGVSINPLSVLPAN